jgi:hypothetical protein
MRSGMVFDPLKPQILTDSRTGYKKSYHDVARWGKDQVYRRVVGERWREDGGKMGDV